MVLETLLPLNNFALFARIKMLADFASINYFLKSVCGHIDTIGFNAMCCTLVILCWRADIADDSPPVANQSPYSFCFNSRRCCASSDKVAVGRANRRGMPIGSPVSSHHPYSPESMLAIDC